MVTSEWPIPRYDDLPMSEFGGRHSWDIPQCKEIGTLGFIGQEQRLDALKSIRSGDLLSLNAPLDLISPPFFARNPIEHSVEVKREGWMLDDRVDSFYPQISSQWDALNHLGASVGTFFGGLDLDTQQSQKANGIDVWARHGIAGRGVLLDMEPIMQKIHENYSPGADITFGCDELEAGLGAQGTALKYGDILIIRTGFLNWYRNRSHEERTALRDAGPQVTAAGVEHSEEISRFLWNSGVSAIASDSIGVEAWPPNRSHEAIPFGFLHASLIGHLGMAIGELWDIDRLRDLCEERGSWDFFVTSAPLNLPGGVGSPANALAIL